MEERPPHTNMGTVIGRVSTPLVLALFTLALSGCAPAVAPAVTPASTAAVTDAPPPTATATIEPSATPDCRIAAGRVEVITYPSLLLDKPIPVRVYIPPCHDQGGQSFPALYLLHGYPYDESEWELLGVDTLVEGAIQAGRWPPFLVVMPRVPDPLFRSTDGGPYSYEAELTEGLVSFIDLTYHTDPRPERRAVAGISRGGVWALEIAFHNPDAFDGVAAISPALSLNSARQEYDPFFLVRRGEALPSRIYLVAGDRDWARQATEDLALLMDGLNLAHRLVIYEGGHEDAAWGPELEAMIDFLAAGWPRP
jgi:enterochelin esterase-like enzyme